MLCASCKASWDFWVSLFMSMVMPPSCESRALQLFDAVEQVENQTQCGVVQRQRRSQPLDSGDDRELGRREAQLAGSVALRIQEAQGDVSLRELRVQPRRV